VTTTESIIWIDPTGISYPLHIGRNSQQGDMTGRFMPGIDLVDDEIPFQPGGRLRSVRHTEHDFGLPCNVLTNSDASLRTALRSLVFGMNPIRGTGIVRVTSPLGDIRQINCVYTGGLDLDENVVKSGRYGQACMITFRAYDPYWQDINDTTQNWTINQVPTFFPIFPLRLTASEIAVNDSINNTGDVPTWPVWNIFGPGGGSDGIVLENVLTNQAITFMSTLLGVNESITIDTRPGFKTVLKNDGTNLFGDLDPSSVLWPLAQGANPINLSYDNAIAGKTGLALSYRRKFLAP
jgi:hypothetical protein